MRGIRVLRNVVTNYFRFVIFAVVGILLTPVLVHGLGDRDYGLWTTVFALTGYFGLIDQGIRPSLVRYVSRDHALGDTQGLSRTVSSAMGLYTVAGVLVMLVAILVAIVAPDRLPIDEAQRRIAPTLILLVGGTIALGFPMGVFAAMLSGVQRYDLGNWVGIAAGVFRAVAFVVVLRVGGGLVELGWTSLLVNLAGHAATAVFALRQLPGVRFSPACVDRAHLKAIGTYSGWAFVGALASNIAFQTDSIVITSVLGPALVTPFAIASGLVEYARSLVTHATVVLAPTASEMDTLGEHQKLHGMLVTGSKYSVLVSWPVLMGLVIFGPNLLTTWVGAKYAHASLLLTILTVPTFLALPQSTASAVLYGVSRHRGIVILSILSALLNLGLSLWWANWPAPMAALFGTSIDPGLVGVAMGTAVPLLLVSGVATAWYACRALHMPLARYAWEGTLAPGLTTIAFLVPALVVQRVWHPIGWFTLGAWSAACWVPFALVAYHTVMPEDERARWRRMFAGLIARGGGPTEPGAAKGGTP